MTRFSLDGIAVEAEIGETIWQVAQRLGTTIPHLCYQPEPGYRADGNCRACMVEIDGERVLAASCLREPVDGMVVRSASARAVAAREMVLELLLADMPAGGGGKVREWGVTASRFDGAARFERDDSHPAMAVNLDACIACGLCVRACREVQGNDVIGMGYRGEQARPVFDFAAAMGESSCVGCGECVQACPTGALLEATIAAGAVAEREVTSLCPYCGVGCQMTYHVAGDRIVAVDGADGPANRKRLCVKGRFGFDYITHPDRLRRPLVRLEGVGKHADDSVDPANPWTHFREASWEEALERAAGGLRRIRDEHGARALAGFGSAKASNEEAYLFQKLVRTGFGSNNVDHCTRLCHASSVAALMEGLQSGAVTAPVSAALDADVIFVIGANPSVNHPVAATFMKNAIRHGTKLILADPRGQALSRHAAVELRFSPGSDVALLNAMLHTIIDEGLTDPAYIAAHTEGFEALRDGVAAFSPEAMAAVCGVPAETLRAAARMYATAKAAMIFWGMGISQHVHGTDNARCLIALALLTGQIGRKGAGLHPLRGQNNVQGASDAGLVPMFFPDYHATADDAWRARLEAEWGAKLDPQRGLTVTEIMTAARAGSIRGMYIVGENPAMSDPDLHHARAALAALEHLVVQDLFLTETAAFADVVLPAAAFAEKSGTFTNTDRRIQMARPVVPSPGEARPDWAVIQDVARGIGLAWDYAGPAEVFAEMGRVMPSLAHISWERLSREGAVTYPVDAEDAPGHELLFGDGFPTPSGRARMVPASVLPPDEVPDQEFPMVLSTGRVLEHWHTGAMTRRALVLDTIEPEAVALLSPRGLQRLGVEPGGFARIRTRRGAVEVRLRADGDVPDGMVFMPFCYAEAAANLLTNPAVDPVGKIPEFKFCAASLEKV
jgi:formate dehydrogenase major subunit